MDRMPIEFTMMNLATLYVTLPLALSSIFFAIRVANKVAIPRILKKQLKLF